MLGHECTYAALTSKSSYRQKTLEVVGHALTWAGGKKISNAATSFSQNDLGGRSSSKAVSATVGLGFAALRPMLACAEMCFRETECGGLVFLGCSRHLRPECVAKWTLRGCRREGKPSCRLGGGQLVVWNGGLNGACVASC